LKLGLPGWSFSGQMSQIWPRFMLLGLQNFSWPFDLISRLLALKIPLAFWLLFSPFYAELGSYEEKYFCSIFSETHL